MLFRVDQLAGVRGEAPASRLGAPSPATPSVGARPLGAPRDDEGVIDLNALASVAPRPPATPLFSEPPPVTLEAGRAVPAPPPDRGNRARLFGAVGAAAALLVVAGYGISALFRGAEPVQHALVATVVPEPLSAPAAPQPPAEPVLVASSEDEVDSAPEEEANPAPTKRARPRAKPRAKTRGKTGPAAQPAKNQPAKKRRADPCRRCKGDFDCILACTAKK